MKQMMCFFNKVEAWLPKGNPHFDEEVYKQADRYETRVKWGPFKGERPLEDDEIQLIE